MAMVSSILTFLLLSFSSSMVSSMSLDEYQCSFCTSSVQDLLDSSKDQQVQQQQLTLLTSCEKYYPKEICLKYQINFPLTPEMMTLGTEATLARDICVMKSFCEALPSSSSSSSFSSSQTNSLQTTNDYDLRISKAMGSRGYDKIRVSVISNATISSDLFTYSQPFQYRWTQNILNTGLVTIQPGQKTPITIGSQTFEIFIPKEGDGIRGILLGDPCFTSEFITCLYAKEFDMFNHTIELLNAANAHDDSHFWMILGDNFYDQSGYPTAEWFAALSTQSKSKVMGSVPGNHDFWINSSPSLWTKKDQLANGFMQMYAQDVIASVQAEQQSPGSTSPYDFSHNPDSPAEATNIPPASDFFFYYLLGNTAFIGYSGAHTYEETLPYLEESCLWAQSVEPASVVLLGHWNNEGYGCEDVMTVPNLYQELKSIPACQPIVSKMKYFMGHQHCNHIVEEDVGFMVGGQGMSDFQCGGDFGIPVLDTTGGRFKVYFFPIQAHRGYTFYQDTLKCFRDNGVSGCYHLAQTWADLPLA